MPASRTRLHLLKNPTTPTMNPTKKKATAMYERLSAASRLTTLTVTMYMTVEFKAKPANMIRMPKNISFVEVINLPAPIPLARTVVARW
jgi:hypothetical protein